MPLTQKRSALGFPEALPMYFAFKNFVSLLFETTFKNNVKLYCVL